MDKDELKGELYEAAVKKAVGYITTESVEELSLIDGQLTVTKKKITTKEVPPDISAIKLLSGESVDQYGDMSEEELILEKQRLLRLLKETDNEANKRKRKNKM